MSHLTESELVAYRQRTLAPEALLAVADHLASCEECRAVVAVDMTRRTAALADSLSNEVSPHPSAELLTAFVLGKLDTVDLDDIAAHLDRCHACAEVVEDVRADRDAAVAGTVSPTSAAMTRSHRAWVYPLAAAAAVILVAAATIVWGTRSSTTNSDGPDVAERAPSPAVIPAVTIVDGSRQIVVTTTGEVLGLDSVAADQRSLVATALSTRLLPLPGSLADLGTARGYLLDGTALPDVPAALVAPIGTFVVEPRPLFEWVASTNAEAVKVEVYVSGFTLIAESGWVNTKAWRPAADLPSGGTYTWQLIVRTKQGETSVPKPPAPQARFRTLDEAARTKLDAELASAGDSRLLRAIVFAQHGIVGQAERELVALKTANPNSTEITTLLAQLRPN